MYFKSRLNLSFILLFLVVVAMVGWGCNQEEITNITISENPDVFSVSGRVISYPSQISIASASYTVMPGHFSGTSDENGYFEIEGMSQGTYQVLVSGDGYATSRVTINIAAPSESKSTVHDHKDFYLMEKSCELDITVHDQETGGIIPGVNVAINYVDFPVSNHVIDLESLDIGGQTDEDGNIVLSGLPATRIYVTAHSFDSDDDGTPDFQSNTQSYVLSPGDSMPAHFVMGPYSGSSPELILTNFSNSYGYHLLAPNLYFVFSTPMDVSESAMNVLVRMDNSPYEEIPMIATWVSSLRLELTPEVALSTPTMDYEIYLELKSEDGYSYSLNSGSFYWETSGGTSGEGDCEEIVTDLTAESPLGTPIDFNTRDIQLSWTAVPCAGGYRIYAHDDRNNPNWIYLRDEPTDFETGLITALCTLPYSFDRYTVDGFQTPFAGTIVTFCVVPLNAESGSPGGLHGIAVVGDEQLPTINQIVQIGNSLNDTDANANLEFKVEFSEYLSSTVADPDIEFVEAGGDPDFVLDPVDATWVWNAGRMSGQFVFTLPVGVDATGDNYRVVFADMADLSGNSNTWFTTSEWKEVMAWGLINDFESSPQNWTRDGEGWAWGVPTIGPGGAHESQRCWGVTLDENHGDNWDTNLYSTVFTVPPNAATLSFWCWYSTDYYDDYVHVFIEHGSSENQIASYHGNSGGWVYYTYSLTQYAEESVSLRFRFTSDATQQYPGFFLDDVLVTSPDIRNY